MGFHLYPLVDKPIGRGKKGKLPKWRIEYRGLDALEKDQHIGKLYADKLKTESRPMNSPSPTLPRWSIRRVSLACNMRDLHALDKLSRRPLALPAAPARPPNRLLKKNTRLLTDLRRHVTRRTGGGWLPLEQIRSERAERYPDSLLGQSLGHPSALELQKADLMLLQYCEKFEQLYSKSNVKPWAFERVCVRL